MFLYVFLISIVIRADTPPKVPALMLNHHFLQTNYAYEN